MYPTMDVDLDGLRLRTLTELDADLLVEATSGESAAALWGPRPAGPYSARDARAALLDWDHRSPGQVSYGVLAGSRLVAAVGLMPDGARVAELAYWVRPGWRRRGIGVRGVRAVTDWAHARAGLDRVWLEINSDNAASLRLAERAGYLFERRVPEHCRLWVDEDPRRDRRHDCLIWVHDSSGSTAGAGEPGAQGLRATPPTNVW